MAQRSINIYGAPVGTLVSYLVMAVMDYFVMWRTLAHRPRLLPAFAGPVVSSLLMALTAWGIYGLCSRALLGRGMLGMLLAMAAAILAAVLVYVIAAVLTRSVTKEDLSLIPGGEKLGRLLHVR